MNTCTVSDLHRARSEKADLLLLDVRTAEELSIASIDGAVHIPLDALPMRLSELNNWQDKEVVCMCHHGMRSARAQQILLSSGFTNVRNLPGGIHAWALEIDPDMLDERARAILNLAHPSDLVMMNRRPPDPTGPLIKR